MSATPILFVSAVSKELRNARQLVATTLGFLGYEADWQEIFATEEGDLRAMLRRRIDQSAGVVQLVGKCYGTEPRNPDETFGRVSYTQYEALYARARGKKVWYLVLDEDFPTLSTEPEPDELKELQAKYRESLRAESRIYHSLASLSALEASVLKLRNDLAELRKKARRWAILITNLLCISVALLVWMVSRQKAVSATVGNAVDAVEGHIEKATAIVEKSGMATEELRESTKRQDVAIHSMNEHMDLSVALALLDRAKESRDGSDQGQVEALQSLIARGHRYEGANLSGISFRKGNLSQGKFKGAIVNLAGATADRADFSETGLRFANLEGASFNGASLAGTYAPFLWAEGAKFEASDFSKANFSSSDLRKASFKGANLRNSVFAFSDLRGANFENADLTGAFFIGAVLDGASFAGATVSGTDFNCASSEATILTKEQFRGVCRHEGLMRYSIMVIERWTSDKYDSGFEHDDFVRPSGPPVFKENENLPLVASPGEDDEIPVFSVSYPGNQRLHLERNYLEDAGRKALVNSRVEQHGKFLEKHLIPGHYLKP